MPINRSPPSQQLQQLTTPSSIPHCTSEPNLSSQTDVEQLNVTMRQKRKRFETDSGAESQLSTFMNDMRNMMMEFKIQQEEKIEKVYSTLDEIRKQNNDICSSIEFMSKSYDSLNEKIQKLELDRQANMKYIQSLEERVEILERGSRSSCVEIKNIPTQVFQSKDQLLQMIISIGKKLNITISPHEVCDIYRIHSNNKNIETKPVIVKFTSVIMKEKNIDLYKKYNKGGSYLTTDSVNISGTSKRIFISENLCNKMKRLFYLCRDYAKVNNFKYCWVSHGKIFLRKTDGAPLRQIKNESDLPSNEEK